MSQYNEIAGWRSTFKSLRHREHWDNLTPDARYFLEQMRAYLLEENKSKLARGDRNIIARPFSQAMVDLLSVRRKLVVSRPAPYIEIAGRRKQANLAFDWWGKRWVIEIKTSMTFDSLASAALEGRAYLKAKAADQFVILSLYDNFNGVDNPAKVALDTLRFCDVSSAGMKVLVVTRRGDYRAGDGNYYERFVNGLEQVLAALPRGHRIS